MNVADPRPRVNQVSSHCLVILPPRRAPSRIMTKSIVTCESHTASQLPRDKSGEPVAIKLYGYQSDAAETEESRGGIFGQSSDVSSDASGEGCRSRFTSSRRAVVSDLPEPLDSPFLPRHAHQISNATTETMKHE